MCDPIDTGNAKLSERHVRHLAGYSVISPSWFP